MFAGGIVINIFLKSNEKKKGINKKTLKDTKHGIQNTKFVSTNEGKIAGCNVVSGWTFDSKINSNTLKKVVLFLSSIHDLIFSAGSDKNWH